MSTIKDPQTGKTFHKNLEHPSDTAFALVSIAYLLLMLLLILWFLFDVWFTTASILRTFGYVEIERLRASSSIRLIAYTVIGGALGGIVNGIRSFITWHCERGAFGKRYTWKYLADPWLGATLALFVFALVQSGVAVLGGVVSPTSIGPTQMAAMFGVGVLAGYGSRGVFVWLDFQVNQIFKIDPGPEVGSPDQDSNTGQKAGQEP
jgi:hypothetical protein